MNVFVAKVGRLVEGSVLDVNKKHLERALKQYDSKLYLKWNPKKNKGYGIWEVRRLPNTKSLIYQGSFQNTPLYTLEYKETNIVNHILDVTHLNYNILTRLKEMDAWSSKTWVADMDYEAKRKQATLQSQIDRERKNLIHDNRRYFKELQEYVKSGWNPFSFFRGTSLK